MTDSWLAKRHAQGVTAWRSALCATVVFVGALSGAVFAHEAADTTAPAHAGWRVGAAAAVSVLHASAATPELQMPGVLGLGQPWRDRRGLRLEHATLGAGLRWSDHLSAQFELGLHDREPLHVEAAWLEADGPLGAADSAATSTWAVGAGRRTVPLGPVLTNAGHFDRFALQPLAKRAAFEGDWVDDGALLAWRRPQGHTLRVAELGVWRAQRFPGASPGPVMPTAHLGLTEGDLAVDAFAARLHPRGRGTAVQSSTAGHSHTAPDCANSLNGVVCFDGRVQLLGGSLRWAPPERGYSVSAAGLWRNERGALYSRSGDTQYRGSTQGGWVDGSWQFAPQWDAALRLERLVATHQLQGPGASLVAQEAALTVNAPRSRVAATLSYAPQRAWRINAELGSEHGTAASSIAANHAYVLLRVVWLAPALIQGNWP